jgi:hypothetical protein
VVKKCFEILLLPPTYGMDIQVQILATLYALHNFIREHENNNHQTLNQDGMAGIESDDCKGNPNSLREQLSLKTNQGQSKVNI